MQIQQSGFIKTLFLVAITLIIFGGILYAKTQNTPKPLIIEEVLSNENEEVDEPSETEMRIVSLYFVHEPTDTQLGGCMEESILPVTRQIPLTNTPLKDTVTLLLQGPTTNERAQGYTSEFPLEGFSFVEANLQEGTAILEFVDLDNKTNGGSCRAGMLATQISRTVTQFEGVERVRFIPEDSLFQP